MSRIVDRPWAGDMATGAKDVKAGSWPDLWPRIGSALVMMGAALGTAASGGAIFDLFWLAASVGILWEWLRLVDKGSQPLRFAFGALVLAGCAWLTVIGRPELAVGLLVTGGLGLAAVSKGGIRLFSGLGLVYAGALIVSLAVLRQSSPFGREAVFFLFAVVWGTDCMAYFGGRLIGGPKLAPRFSPSKTWSGFLIGIVSGSLLGWVMSPASAPVAYVLGIGLLAGAVAQGGDIVESMIKRRFNAKDTGTLIPGHGGIMDRLDGFLAASVLAAGVGAWRTGLAAAGAGLFQW